MTRRNVLLAARVAFVVLTVAFAWWGFRGRWDEITGAMAETSGARLALAVAVTLVGLVLTALLWRRLLARLGSPVPQRDAAAVFFVGQLGKYIPGSVWSFAAQAQLGRRHQVPARASIAASAVFLVLHTFTGIVLGGVLAATGVVATDPPRWLWAMLALGAAAALAPPLIRLLGSRIAGQDVSIDFTTRDLGVAAGLMLAVWISYGAAALALLGSSDRASVADLPAVTGAFALSHAAGVLLVIAPAGLGAREGVLIALLAPVVGTAPAAATALLARVAHTLADFAAAALAGAVVGAATPAPPTDTGPRSASWTR